MSSRRPVVLLVTYNLLPEGEPGGDALLTALADRGVDATWVRWDDPEVDWAAADLIAVRAAWDYHRRLPEFLAWARETGSAARMLIDAEVFAWNADKAYLGALAATGQVPVVPTVLVDDRGLVAGLEETTTRWGTVVVKPRVGAGGVGVVVADGVRDTRLDGLVAGPWVVQPLIEAVRTVGETSIYVFDGRAAVQVDKSAAGDEVRVNELYGGTIRRVPLDPERAGVAERAVRAAAERWDADLPYARVDLMPWNGAWAVSELELIEPGLYLDVDPSIALPFADLVAARVR